MDKESVKRLVNEALEENGNLFLIELSFLSDNKILVEVDGDSGVNLKECIRISRHVEHNLDREEEDFALEVTSVNITKPLKVQRQYKKNIGRTMGVKTTDGEEFEGILMQSDENQITLEWKALKTSSNKAINVTLSILLSSLNSENDSINAKFSIS